MQIKIPQRTVILTPEHLTRLGQAFFEVVQDEEIMEGFAYALTWGGINIETVTSEDIQRHLLNALSQYAQEQEVGLSADPL